MRKLWMALVVCMVSASVPVSASEVIGKAASVRRDAKGIPPDAAERAIAGGSELHGRERLVVSPTGDVQVVFLDETTLSVGPGSDLVLDEFVYDPQKSEKTLSVKLQRGATRLIGGKVTKEGAAEIGTSNATIAIRGGIVIVSSPGESGKETRALLGLGTMTCTAGADSVTVTEPGMLCIVGRTIVVRRAGKAEIAELIASLVGTGALDPPLLGKDASQGLAITCGGLAALSDPNCAALRGFAGVDPEPLGYPHDAEKLADTFDQLQDPVGTRGVPGDTAQHICESCR